MSTKRILAGLVALLMALSLLPAISLADSLGEYAPITTMEELVEGDYVLYNVRDTYSGIMNNTFSGGRFKASTPSFNGDNIVVTDGSVVWHIAYVEGYGYTVYNAASAKYAEIVTDSTSGFAFNDAPTMYYTIEVNEDGTFDIYNADVARALFLLAEKGRDGEVYVIGSGQSRPLKDYLYQIRDLIDPSLSLDLGAKPLSELAVTHLACDITKIREDVGFTPMVSFEEGILETIRWNREQLDQHTGD